jgi:hypothetical protein
MAADHLRPEGQPVTGGRPRYDRADDLVALRAILAETCQREAIAVTPVDIEVLELLLAGYTAICTAQAIGLSLSEVRRSRDRWSLVCRLAAGAADCPA